MRWSGFARWYFQCNVLGVFGGGVASSLQACGRRLAVWPCGMIGVQCHVICVTCRPVWGLLSPWPQGMASHRERQNGRQGAYLSWSRAGTGATKRRNSNRHMVVIRRSTMHIVQAGMSCSRGAHARLASLGVGPPSVPILPTCCRPGHASFTCAEIPATPQAVFSLR